LRNAAGGHLVYQNIKLEQITILSTLRFLEYKLDLYVNKKCIHEHRVCRLVKHCQTRISYIQNYRQLLYSPLNFRKDKANRDYISRQYSHEAKEWMTGAKWFDSEKG
jgi:hypothetical protein